MDEIKRLFTILMGWEGEDLRVVDAAFAAYVAIFLRGWIEPPWLGIVSAASTGKSATLNSFKLCQSTELVSDISAKGLASGFRDDANPNFDPSILSRLQGGKVMLVHELTTLINKGEDQAKTLFGTLRAAFDGTFVNNTGRTGAVPYKDRFGFVFGCTPMLDEWILLNQQLGERSVLIRMPVPQGVEARKAAGEAALKLSPEAKEALWREVQEKTAALVSECKRREPPTDDPVIRRRIRDLANVVVMARSVHHDGSLVAAEGQYRMTQQLDALCAGHSLVLGRESWSEESFPICQLIARHTIHPELLKVLEVVWRGSAEKAVEPMTREQCLAQTAGAKKKFMGNQLDQWAYTRVLKKLEGGTFGMDPEFAADAAATGFLLGG